jgi:glycosyltransferase involved in cell wall biosynthesis
MSGVHLFVPMLHRHDAVGDHTLALRDRLVASGVRTTIFTEIPDPATAADTRHYLEYESESEPGDVLVYQFATESVIARWLARRPEPVVINYHSITPPVFFDRWNNGIARLQVGAQVELGVLAPRAALGVAVSRFDERELRDAGCARTKVIPVANVAVPPVEPDPQTLERLRDRDPGPGHRWLSVGRLAPNKAHHETIAALFVARASSDPGARLTVVGSPAEPAYATALVDYAASLGLADSVAFVSGLTDAELAGYYRFSDVLLMLSEHEGFGVPLVEAMGQGLPIVAFDAGAVAEVLGGAGVLLEHKHPRRVARAVTELMENPRTRSRLVDAARIRFSTMGLEDAGELLVEAVRSVTDGVPAAR